VPPPRLLQYLEPAGSTYRLKRALREQVTFAKHNVLRDPPFSRVDLISCRNLLIYLERDVQAQVLEVFHFALNPGGLLFLGSAETADWLPELFTAVDKKHRVYRSNPAHRSRGDLVPLRPDAMPPRLLVAAPASVRLRPGLSAVQPLLLDRDAQSSVLVDRQHGVVYIGGGATRYLRQTAGVPSRSVLDMVRPELADALRPALLHSLHTGQRVAARPVVLVGSRGPVILQIGVRPNGAGPEAATLVVSFEEFDTSLAHGEPSDSDKPGAAHAILEEEIRRLHEQLRACSATPRTRARHCAPPTRSCSRSTRSCARPPRSSRPARKSCSRSTRSS
jgi:two-component system CheB/CheR fusion protein